MIQSNRSYSCLHAKAWRWFQHAQHRIRASKVFGLDSVIFVSQQFHNERALFLAEKNGLDAIGYNARDVKSRFFRTKRFIREHLARVKMYLDIWLGRQPKYLGEPISVG